MEISSNARKLLRLNEVLRLIPLKKPTIYRAIRAGKFPAPCKLLEWSGPRLGMKPRFSVGLPPAFRSVPRRNDEAAEASRHRLPGA